MKNSHFFPSRRLVAGLFAAALFAPILTSSASAHVAPCSYCDRTITQDTATQDNEVALKFGRKRIEYKCVYCALAEAQSDYKGDLSILAPSEKKGEPIVLQRQSNKWSASTPSAVFVLNEPLQHKVCNVQARAFTSKTAAQSYVAAQKTQFPQAQILSLDAFVKSAGDDGAPAGK